MKSIKLFLVAFLIWSSASLALAQSSAPAAPPADGSSAAATGSADLSPSAAAAIQKRLETYFRNLFALGPNVDVQSGPVNKGPMPGFYEVQVKITIQGQSSVGVVYVSSDGRYMLRGEVEDLNVDPLADVRSHIQLDGYASKGPADAKVTIVEYGDLECPSCRQFEPILRSVLPKYPQVRFVFKDFPLEQVHPWAKTAAIAAHCVLKQSTDAFWKFHDTVYDDQDQVTVDNAFDKLAEFAAEAGVDPAAYKACLIDPAAAEAVAKSQEEGRSLGVTGTPTTFVNGRRITGPDPNLLQQYLDFDLNTQSESDTKPTPPTGRAPASATTAAPSSLRPSH